MGCPVSIVAAHENERVYNVHEAPRLDSKPSTPKLYSRNEVFEMRETFWSTRVENNQQMWASLKGTCEALLGGDMELAHAIMSASNLRTLAGNTSLEEVYDERGGMYSVPSYCYTSCWKTNEAQEMSEVVESKDSSREETPIPSSSKLIECKVRIHPGLDIIIKLASNDSILNIKRKIETHVVDLKRKDDSVPLCPAEQQRIMLFGRECKDSDVLTSFKSFEENTILQVFVKRKV